MNKKRINIWGRDFEMDIEYDCYSDEEVSDMQKNAVEALENAADVIEAAKAEVENYCITNNHDEIGAGIIDNIFKYVIPKYLFVKRDNNKRIVAIMCNYKFDMENGIAIVFEDEKFVKVGKQDIIL